MISTHSGWRLEVAPDGNSAVLHAPGAVVVSELTGTSLRIQRASQPSDPLQALPVDWDVDLAEAVLRRARPEGMLFMRALVDAGGTATVAHLKDVTGMTTLHHTTQSLTSALVAVLRKQDSHHTRRNRHFFQARPLPGKPHGGVHDYHLPDELVPLFHDALLRLGH